MLQKFALAFKTKTIEFFAEEEEEEEDNASIAAADFDAVPEEVITGQRVVVLKPDPPPLSNPNALVSSIFAVVSSLRAAYLHLQIAHSPFDPDAVRAADRAIVSHLHRLSELKRTYYANPQCQNINTNPSPSPSPLSLSFHLEPQVQENQGLLRVFENVINRLQSDIDRKDDEAAELRLRLREAEAAGDSLQRRLEQACLPPEENLEALLTLGVFNSVLKDSCRSVHRFARVLVDLMNQSGWDLKLVADSIYPDICFSKAGHFRYAILSYFCLKMFELFDSDSFGCQSSRMGSYCGDLNIRRSDSLREFIQHSYLDPLKLMNSDPYCDFARFCHSKYEHIINSGLESSLFGNSGHFKPIVGNLKPSSPLYEMFVNMVSSMWMLHKLAWAYDPMVEIFQIGRGTEFSMVYMESVCRKSLQQNMDCWHSKPKVGFTVVPGFRVGKTVIQCWVYLDGMK